MSKVKWKVIMGIPKWWAVVREDVSDKTLINCYTYKALARRVCRLLNREEKERK